MGYTAMKMSQILKFEDSPKTKKSKFFEKTFFLQINKFIHFTLRATIWQKKNSLPAKVAYKY